MRGILVALTTALAHAVPQQINLHYTAEAGVLSVDFVAVDSPGNVSLSLSAAGPWTVVPTTFFPVQNIGVMHQARLPFNSTVPGVAGYNKVATASGESALFTVYPTPVRGNAEKVAIFGDFGLRNDKCMADLVAEAAKGSFDSVVHVGDFAYDMEEGNSTVGNAFMSLMQGYGATKPVMPAEGNHEACGGCEGIPALGADSAANFTQYKARFHSVSQNSNSGNNRFYSFNRGLTHFVVFSAEAYVFSVSAAFLANQLQFVKADLAAVNRSATPWVVALVHKDWTMQPNAFADFSPVLEAAGVDVLFCGHVHYYNRYMPFDPVTNKVDTSAVSADGAVYTNPLFMTTIVSGGAGNHEDEKPYVKVSPSYTGIENYGWGIWQALNATHATWNWHTSVPKAAPANWTDSLTIIQTGRGH